MKAKRVDILVVEDQDHERAAIVAALEAAVADVNIVAISNGLEALDFLFARGIWENRSTADPPKLIMLDLGLPGADGLTVLTKIRSLDPQDPLALTPIVIFSDSQKSCHLRDSYRGGANSFILKPVHFPDFLAVVEKIGNYWVHHNKIFA